MTRSCHCGAAQIKKRVAVRALVLSALLLLFGCGQGAEDEQAEGERTHPGKVTYERWCISCHHVGVSGAPQLTDSMAWQERLREKGRPALTLSSISGLPPGMPPRGLCRSCSDEELDQAVSYMLREAGLN